MFKNIVLALSSLLIFFSCLEFGAIFFVPSDTTYKSKMQDAFKGLVVLDDQLGYKLAGQSNDKSQNYRVYAHKNVSIAKAPETFRIICVGGSTTLGVNNWKDSSPAMLQDLFDYALAGCSAKVEVINAGMMGYHSWHSRLRAGLELDQLSPDMYLVMDGPNDVIAAGAIDNIDDAIKQKDSAYKVGQC